MPIDTQHTRRHKHVESLTDNNGRLKLSSRTSQ